MLFFLRASDGSLFYLLNNKQYSVGRKLCDILIKDDQSISRKHAVFTIKDDVVTLMDCGSKYKTFIDKTEIQSGIEVVLSKKNVIQFGALQSIYTFDGTPLITTTSSIKTDQKIKLRDNVTALGGSLLQNWTVECTHVTVEEIMLTAKVLCAIIQGIPIVKLKYWDDYVENVKQNLAAPDVTTYLPNCSEAILSKNVSLKYKPERKELFSNKVFVFQTKSEKDKVGYMITLAGGETISWDENPLTRDDLHKSSKEYVVIQTSEVTEQKLGSNLFDFVNYYNSIGKRTILLQEIALAIVRCSCEKDCNPDFDKKGVLLSTVTQSESQKRTENVLASATESQSLYSTQNVKTEVVPQSLENVLDEITVDKMEIGKESLNDIILNETKSEAIQDSPNEIEIPSSMKRESESIDTLHTSKKIKMDPSPFAVKKLGTKADITHNFEFRSESVRGSGESSGKNIFAFKKDKRASESTDKKSTDKDINPFARKRKLEQNENNENPPKKSVNDSLAVPSTSFGSSSISKEKPISNVLKLKNSTLTSSSSQNSHIVMSKSNSKSKRTINENANSLQIHSSKITVVDSGLEKSYRWISKSDKSFKKESTVNGDASIDEEMQKYIESFRDSVVIDEKKEEIHRKCVIDNNNDPSVTDNKLKNFKKFRKVQPVNAQTTIVPESSYVDVICNHNCSIEVVPAESENDSDADGINIDSQVRTVKRRGKRFEF